ncbi:apolipoprotein N-acyltransferase [Candidatus Phycosocius bacilliformis]|uniref:Apolipoprotein N-acyltransferase n=1 Tax=Candidatus Phycosocius bacilliformis TaxID=1445552 RepID=A0A2P2EDP6_9PROT|nr:apolipoprotein N-acyltransferase [Candidatus Phycosocius bacilliformis]GBF59189.1 apolipoprotein N-acyltransferase [Candidatus Phycosocius bacilliformis]
MTTQPNAQPFWLSGLISTGLGALAVLGHAPFHIWPAFAFALCGLILLLDGAFLSARPKRSAFWRAWAWGFGYFLAGMFWVGNAFLVDAEKFATLMPFAVAALPAGLALFWGLAGLVAARFWSSGLSRLIVFATCVAAVEYARGHVFTGLPWNLPAYIWKPGGAISQVAALIGPYGLTLISLFVLSLPLILISTATVRAQAAYGGVGLVLILACFGYGALKLQAEGPVSAQTGTGPVIAAGQAGFSQKEVWDPANTTRVVTTYLDLLETPDAEKADILVWPEGAFPFLLLEEPVVLEAIQGRLGDRTLALGSIRRDLLAGQARYNNSILVFDVEDGGLTTRAVYDKYHLVPFGEYLPFRTIFEKFGIASLVAYDGEMTPGVGPGTLAVPKAPLADPRVCYEIVFPHFNPKATDQAAWILNVSVDAWYGDLLGPDQHYAQARYRAIETGMPVVRAASGGWSAIVDRLGRPVAEHRTGAGYATARLPAFKGSSPYARIGDWAFLILCVGFGVFALWSHKRH